MIVEDDNFEVVGDKEDGEFVVEVVVGLNDNSKKNSKKKNKKKKIFYRFTWTKHLL